ncbi:MAG: hypothetical protein HOW73_11375 [Polyangiaceae bacterium]|nr:hypothetical protein [Polyangiaceae bacterium]
MLALAWAIAPRPRPFDTATVAEVLGNSLGGVVGADDYVWEPSRGILRDVYPGRGVIFLGRHEEGAPREVYRARVSVLPSGRPLRARLVTALTATTQGDETDLAIVGGRAVFATRFGNAVQSVTVLPIDEAETGITIAVAPPAPTIEYEMGADELVVRGTPASVSVIDLRTGGVSAGQWVDVLPAERPIASVAPPPVSIVDSSPSAAESVPPVDYEAMVELVDEGDPAVSLRQDGAAKAVFLDGRQLDFALVPGWGRPPATTGMIPERIETNKPIVVALELVSARISDLSGAMGRHGFLAPMLREHATFYSNARGALEMGPWSLGPWDRSNFDTAIQWSGDAGRAGRHVWCVTSGGHLAAAWTTGEDDPARLLPPTCVRTASAAGAFELASWGQAVDLAEHPDRSLIVATARSREPAVSPPRDTKWEPAASGQPAPAFLPAIHTVTAQVLGADVTVFHVDPSRFEWRIVAGTEERSHRHGGAFPTALPADERDRARIAIGLGVAKRRGPRGLRIDGSTGHPFQLNDALLVAGPTLGVASARDVDPESVADDVAELPMSVLDGQLASLARERGPRQVRVDLCVKGEGMLLAQSEFDSHEANATVLGQLGCERALVLDRGAEHPGFVVTDDGRAGGPFEDTALIGLARPLVGAVTVTRPN